MKIDCVFSGGGVKAFAFIGAIESIQEQNIMIERTAGTSAGAIVSGLITAGYQIEEIKQMMNELNLAEFLDAPILAKVFPFTKWLFLYFKLGLYKGDELEKWLYDKLAEKNIYTFKDIKEGYLRIIVSDISLEKLVVIPDDLEKIYGIDPAKFSVARAIRMSAGFPYFFMPKKILGNSSQESLIVDGGLLSNFPLWVFENENKKLKRPVLGIKLMNAEENNHEPKINNAIKMFQALFSTMKIAHDNRYVSKANQQNIVYIPVKDIQTMNLNLTEQMKKGLIESGRISTSEFLKHWPN